MNLRQIEFVLAVAEESSFTRAASRCHTVQSALSHQVARLEDELGTPLFERTSRRVRLTLAGEAFVRQAHAALEATRRIPEEVAAAAGQVRGQLAIGTISALGSIDIVALIEQFHARHPQVEIRLTQSGSEELLVRLRQRRLDVALIGLWQGEKIEGMAHLRIAQERLVALLPPEHPLASRRRLTLERLATLPLVDYPQDSSARRQTDKAFAAAGVAHQIHFEVNHLNLIAQFVSRGLAASLVPESVATKLDGVVHVAVQDAPNRVLYVVWPKLASPPASAFVALLREQLDFSNSK
ncbi:LysR family transcriptional regulator [Herbaspirillum camelliae]|uniref:LysR family transcriptional regulator n=1 Tax=Herbaspirillum camelliae TaxID=1892903 RepID=UPI000949D44F|nr:LysR family transcriptional regulator [Herbaspirillum camelliae]